MLAELSIYPMNTDHMSNDVARVVEVLDKMGLEYRLGPMGTSIEGELQELLVAIQRCHEAVAGGHDRVITTVVLDDHKSKSKRLGEMIASVEEQLGRKVPT